MPKAGTGEEEAATGSQSYAPELNKRCQPPHLKPSNKSYRIDETYMKVKGRDPYLYRAVYSTGDQMIIFLLIAKPAAAKRFLGNATEASGRAMSHAMNVDKTRPIRLL